MKKHQLKILIGGFSFASALFVFQACYGMPQDMMDDVFISGKVVSQSTGLPVEGIKVESETGHYDVTTNEGSFAFYSGWADSLKLSIEDTDPASSGNYISKDTVLVNPDNEIILNISIEEH